MGGALVGIWRARVHAPILLGVLGTAALLSGIALTIVGQVDAAIDDGARAIAARHTGADLVIDMSLHLAEDPDRQDDQVRAAIARSLSGIRTPYRVDRTVSADASLRVVHRGGSGEKRLVTVASVPDLPDRGDLVAGSWAVAGDDVVVQADAAEELGVRPGDLVTVGDLALEVTGTWRARDHLDPRWVGDAQVAVGTEDGGFGPVVIDESRWSELAAEPRVHWVLVPDLEDVTAADLDAVTAATDQLDLDWRGRVDGVEDLAVDGRLAAVADEVELRTDGLRAVQPVVLLLLAAVGLVTLTALARLFVSTHAQELSLLWARGASAGALAASAALEAAVAAAVGGVVGALAAAWAGPSFVAAALAVGAVTVAAAALLSAQVLRSAGRTAPAWRAGRLVGPGLVALAVAAAALAVWQLRSYGSPVTVDSRGNPTVDPIAVAAPAALLVALVLLGLVLFPLLAGRAERRTRTDDVTRVLAARNLSRRLVPVTAPLLAVAVAASTLVAAATYADTWADGFDRTRQLRSGADVRVTTDEPGLDTSAFAAVTEVAGVHAVAPVTVELGGDAGSLVAVSPAALDSLGRGFPDEAARARAVEAITNRAGAPELPPGTDRVGIVLETVGLGGPPSVTLVLADAAGLLREVRGDLRDGAGLSYDVALPPDLSGVDGAWTIAALELDVEWRQPEGEEQPAVGLVAVSTTGAAGEAELDTGAWTARVPGDRELALQPGREAPSGDVVVDPDVRRIRLTPSYAPGSPDGPRARVVLSRVAADRLGLGVGDPLTISLDGTYDDLQTEVAGVVPAVPGAPEESAVLVDLRVVEQARLSGQDAQPSPTTLWIGAADPETAMEDLRPALLANTRIETATDAAGRTALGTTARAWWLAAAGCGMLALLTLVTVAHGQLRSRRGDAAVLRALGLSMQEQQRLRGRELVWTVAFALVIGLVAGAAVAALVVPQLARAAVPQPFPTIGTALGVDVPALLGGALLLAGALAAGIGWYRWRVGAEVRGLRGPEGAP